MKTKEIGTKAKNKTIKLSKKLIATAILMLVAIGSLLAYFTSTDAVRNWFKVKNKYNITYEYYTVNTLDGTETHLDKQELNKEGVQSLYPETVVQLGANAEYLLSQEDLPSNMEYVRMDFKIVGEEEKRNSGYEFSMPEENLTINQYYYLTPLNGNIIIHHYRAGTGTQPGENPVKLAEDEELTERIGKTFTVTNLIDTKNSETQEYVNKLIIDGTEVGTPRNYLNGEGFSYQNVEVTGEGTTTGAQGQVTGTITQNDIVINYYYNATSYNISGEVLGDNGEISNITEEVLLGNNSTKDIIFTPDLSYRVGKIMVYSGDEITAYRNGTTEGIGTQIQVFDEEKDEETKKLVATMDKFENVTANKLVVVQYEPIPTVAKIIAVPSDTEDLTSDVFPGEKILNHEYFTLQEALDDAYLVNQTTGETNKLVEIIIIDNIRNENVNIINPSLDDGETITNVSIDLNGFTINNNKLKPTIDVNENSTLIIKDTSVLETGKITSKKGIGVFVKNDAELTLGINENPISIQAPYIEGKTYGIYKEQIPTGQINPVTGQEINEEGTLNFYDGRVVGQTAIFGKVDDWPITKNVYVEYNTETNLHTAYLANLENIEAVIGKRQYTQVETAIEEANSIFGKNGEPVEVDLVSAAVVESTMNIQAGRNITFDLNGFTLSSGANAAIFANNGNFTIKDNEEEKGEYHLIAASDSSFIIEEGKIVSNTKNIDYFQVGTTSMSYIPIDLTSYSGNVTIAIDAEQNGVSNAGWAKTRGSITVNTQRLPDSTEGRIMDVVGGAGQQVYETTVQGGKKYYIGLYLYKGYGDNQELIVNSIKINGEEINVVEPKGAIVNSVGPIIENNGNALLTLNGGKYIENGNNTIIFNNDNANIVINNAGIESNGRTSAGIDNRGATTSLVMNGGYIKGNNPIYNWRSVTINDGSVINRVYNYATGNLVVNNGLLTGTLENRNANTETASVTINNGEISYIYNKEGGIVNIEDTNAKRYTTVENYKGTVNLNGGNIYRVINGNGSYNTTAIFNMAGGTIETGGDTNSIINYRQTNITGGNIISNGSCAATIYNNNNATINISNLTITDTSTNSGEYSKSHVLYNGYNSTMNISGNTKITSENKGIIQNYETGIVNIESGNYVSNSTNISAINNPSTGTINIGIKNTQENTEVSKTNPTIKTENIGIVNGNGTLNFYDGQIIAPVNNTLQGGIHEIEEKDAEGNNLDINISTITENENNYHRMILDSGNTGIARILKSSTNLDMSQIPQDRYYETIDEQNGEQYYVFYTLEEAIKVCDSNAGENKTTIELLDNINTVNSVSVAEGKNIVLNLKGKTINCYAEAAYLQNNGKMEIIDLENGNGITTLSTVIENNGTMTLNVKLTNNKRTGSSDGNKKPNNRVINNNGTLTINGGVITGYYATVLNNTNKLTINNGTINAYCVTYNSGISWALANEGNAKCTINNGTLYNNYGSSSPWGESHELIYNSGTSTLRINGGTFNDEYGYYITNTSASKYVENESEPAVYITGGTFTTNNWDYRSGISDSSSGECDIWIIKDEGSNFYIKNNKSVYITNANLRLENVTINSSVTARGSKSTIKNSVINDGVSYKEGSGTSDDEIINSTINNGISRSAGGNLSIENSNVTGETALYTPGNSNITIKNSILKATRVYGIDNGASTVTILSEENASNPQINTEIIGSGSAINNVGSGTIILGKTQDGTVSTVYPKVTSTGAYSNGVENGTNAKFYFYDGSITANTSNSHKAINGSVSGIEPGYAIVTTQNGNNTETAILSKVSVAKILKTSLQGVDLSNVDYSESEDGLYYEFFELQDAINICTSAQTNIILINSITYIDTDAGLEIPNSKNIILDLNGYNITASNNNTLTNNGTLKIIDGSTGKTSELTFSKNAPFTNNGTLTLEGIHISATFAGGSIDNNYLILNNTGKTVNLKNNTVTMANSSQLSVVKNLGTLNAEGGSYNNDRGHGYFVNNLNEATVKNLTLIGLGFYNQNPGTIEAIDLTVTYGETYNYSTKEYSNNSKPAIRFKGGNYYLTWGNQYNIDQYKIRNYAGEIIIENNTQTSNNIKIDGIDDYGDVGTIDNENGKITINSGEIVEGLNINNGIVNMNGGTISGNGDRTRVSINVSENAIFNINSGKIGDYASITNNGTTNVGKISSTISTENPFLNLYYQLENNNILNFNNGKISTSNIPVKGIITSIPEDCEVIYEIDGSTHSYTLSKTDVVATIGSGANLQEFTTLKDAIEYVTTNNHTQIDLQKSIAVTGNNKYEISSTQDITLNLNGNRMVGNNTEVLFTNNGKFEIVDTTGGNIIAYNNGIIKNTNTLKISGGNLIINGGNNKKIVENTGAGTVEVTGGYFQAASTGSQSTNNLAYGIYSTSTGNITVNGGTFNLTGIDNYGYKYAYAVYVNNSDTENKPTVQLGGNYKVNETSYSYGISVNNTTLNVSGGENKAKNNAINNTEFTITAGTITGSTTINAESTGTISGTAEVGEITNNGTTTLEPGITTGTITNNKILTVNGGTIAGALTNNSELTLNNGTIQGRLTNKNKAILNGGTISTTNQYAVYSNSSIGTEINSGVVIETTSSSTSSAAIYVESGKCNVYEGVTVTATSGTGVYVNSGTFTLGLKARPVSTTSPVITGLINGINNNGTFNFYDGIITGSNSGALTGNAPADLPDNYAVQTSANGSRAWLESSAQASDVAMSDGQRFQTLQSAINTTTSGNIEIIDNINLQESVTIPSGKNIVIDLAGCYISYNGAEATIINNGTLTIIDSHEDGQSTTFSVIGNEVGPAIENNGTLTIGSDADATMYTNSPRIIGRTYAVVNSTGCTFKFYDGVLKGATAAVSGTITNTSTISGYTLTDGTETQSGVQYYTKYYAAN